MSLKNSYNEQVNTVVNEILEFKKNSQMICYWSHMIRICIRSSGSELKQILDNLYSVSIRMDRSISKREHKDKFYEWIHAGFTALSKEIVKFESNRMSSVRKQKFVIVGEKVLQIVIKSIVRHSRR